jgi:hypothetical protein
MTDIQSVSLSWNKAPIWGLTPDFYYCQTVAGLLMWGALKREDRSVIYNCCWFFPAQSFLGLSPVGLVTIFYCPRIDTLLLVASSDSQGYGGSHHIALGLECTEGTVSNISSDAIC